MSFSLPEKPLKNVTPVPMLLRARNAEVAEDQGNYKDVIEAESLLQDIAGEELKRSLLAGKSLARIT